MFSNLRKFLGLETDNEKYFRYQELKKSFDELSNELDGLAETFFEQKRVFVKAMNDPENETIREKIEYRFEKFLESHKEDIRKTKKEYDLIKSEVKELEKSLSDVIKIEQAYSKIKKAYKSNILSFDDFNKAVSKISKNGKVKYADFLLFNEKDELLLLKRSQWEDDHKGAWVIPGGHVDLGEEFEAAALRELWEESGYRPDKCFNVGNYVTDKIHIEYYKGYINTLEQSPLLDVNESRAYEWVRLDDIDDYEMIFNMKDNIKKILNLKTNKINIKKASEISSDEVSNEDNKYILKSELASLYKKFFNEIEKAEKRYSFLIEKGFDDEANKIFEEIEKAKKDITKLNKIKKLIYRDGKLVFGTYYVKTGEEIEDKEKTSKAGNIDIDVEEGVDYECYYAKSKSKNKVKSAERVTGVVAGIGYSKKENLNYFCIVDEEGKKHWLSNKNVLSFKRLDKNPENEIQVDEDGYQFIKDLGGSTGAKLVQDKWGNKYVKKTGKDKEHIYAEYQALKLYNYLDVKVPKIHSFDKDKGVLYTEYIENAKTLDELKGVNHIKKQIQKNFAIDALLGNWDVVGMVYDNILIDDSGFVPKIIRVDVGGSLNKRAQGENKEFGPTVNELETLLNPDINPQTAKIFEGVDVQEAIATAISNYDNFNHYINSDTTISDEIKYQLGKRVNYLRTKIIKQDTQELIEKLNYKGKLYDLDEGYYSEDIVNFYNKLNEDMKIDEEDLNLLIKEHPVFSDEQKCKKRLMQNLSEHYPSGEPPYLAQKAIENGVTWQELLALNMYTGTSGYVNNAVTSYIESKTGNLNFDKGIQKEEIKLVNKEISIDLNDAYYDIMAAAKSINYAMDQGKVASEANLEKIKKAKDIYNRLKEIIDIEIKNPGTFTEKQSSDMIKVLTAGSKVIVSLNKNQKVDHIEPVEDFSTVNHTVTENEVIKTEGVKVNGIQYKTYNWTFAKMISNAIRKLEDIKDKNFYVEGLFNRGIDTKKYGTKFDEEHKDINEHVMHTWGSSSSWNTSGFANDRDTHLKIVSKGVHIDSISQYKGSHESEVLIRPFTMYKTIGYREQNEKNKKEIVLMRIV